MKGARKTTLTFGEEFAMVQMPVAVAPVVSSKSDVKTEFIGPSGEKVETKKVDPATGEVLGADQIERAIKNGDGYVAIPADDWDTITEETKPSDMEVTEFVSANLDLVKDRLAVALDAHYVQPQPGAAGSLGVLTAAMRTEKKVGIVRWGAGSRQRLGILRVTSDGALVVQTVPFAADVQEPDEDVLAPAEAEISPKAKKLGKALIERLTGDGSTLVQAADEAVVQRQKLVADLLKGKKPTKSKKKETTATKSVEEALEAVLG